MKPCTCFWFSILLVLAGNIICHSQMLLIIISYINTWLQCGTRPDFRIWRSPVKVTLETLKTMMSCHNMKSPHLYIFVLELCSEVTMLQPHYITQWWNMIQLWVSFTMMLYSNVWANKCLPSLIFTKIRRTWALKRASQVTSSVIINWN